MTSTVLDIWNAALLAVNGRGQLSSLTEASRERELCARFYDLTVQTVQEAANWPASRSLERLALVSTQAALWVPGLPPPEYTYAYALPSGYLRAWYMSDYSEFIIGYDAITATTQVYSNTPEAILTYSRLQPVVQLWTPGQQQATIYGLAGHIAGALTGKPSLIQASFQKANRFLEEAQASAVSQFSHFESVPDWIAARNGQSAPALAHFTYPFGAFFSG